MDITKADIIKYFGSIELYREWVTVQIDLKSEHLEKLEKLATYEIFEPKVNALAINNSQVQRKFEDFKTELIVILREQIAEFVERKRFTFTLD